MRRRAGILAVLMLGISLSGCGETISATLTIDPDGGQLIYFPNGSTEPVEVAPDDPVFDLAGTYSYTAEADSELPEIIATLQCEKEGYHFSGWGNVVNGEVKTPYLTDFSSARMPYSDATYRAVFQPLASIEFIPVDEDFQPLILDGDPAFGLTLSGEDIYVTATLDNTRVAGIVDQLNSMLPDWEHPEGAFSGIYPVESSEEGKRKPVGSITIEEPEEQYYAVFTAYPMLNIHYSGSQEDVSFPLAPGTPLADYMPSTDPELTGAVFEGWYSDPDYTVPFYPDDEGLVMTTSDLDVYAHFCIPIPVTYELPDGWTLGGGSPEIVLTDTAPDNLVDPIPPKGFTFENWYIDMNGYGVYNAEAGEGETPDILLDGRNRIPNNIDSVVLRPKYSEWNSVYVDLRETGCSSVPEGLTETSESSGIYSVYALPGEDLSAYQSLDGYTFESADIQLVGFDAYFLDIDDGQTLADAIDAAEAGTHLADITEMPTRNVVLKPRFSNVHYLTLHFGESEDETVKVSYLDDELVKSPTDSFLLQGHEIEKSPTDDSYLADVLTGWKYYTEDGEPDEGDGESPDEGDGSQTGDGTGEGEDGSDTGEGTGEGDVEGENTPVTTSEEDDERIDETDGDDSDDADQDVPEPTLIEHVLTYPHTFTGEITDLYPIYTRKTQIQVKAKEDCEEVIFTVANLEGERLDNTSMMTISNYLKGIYPDSEDGITQILGYKVDYVGEGEDDAYFPALSYVKFGHTNCVITPIIRPASSGSDGDTNPGTTPGN